MKRAILITVIALIGSSNLHAKEILTNPKRPTINQSKRAKIEAIEAKIKKYEEYLRNLPIKTKQIIAELSGYKDKGNEAERMTKDLLVTLDMCATNELNEMAASACNDINEEDVSVTIKTYQAEIEDMIAMATKRLEDLKIDKKNAPIIEHAKKALENARDILKGVK